MGVQRMSPRVTIALLLLGVCAVAADPGGTRRYTSSYASSSSFSSGYTSASTSSTSPTPTPPASSTTVSLVQKLTLSITAAQYTGKVMVLMNTAVGIVYKIYVNTAWLTDCSVTSQVSSRRAVVVQFTATMPTAQGAAANTAAKAMTAASLATAATQAKTALGATYGNTTIPLVSNILAPACTGTGCTTTAGAISAVSFSLFTLVAVPIAFVLQHK